MCPLHRLVLEQVWAAADDADRCFPHSTPCSGICAQEQCTPIAMKFQLSDHASFRSFRLISEPAYKILDFWLLAT